MAKQTFTSGQVLTAAEMNSLQENDYNWTVTTKTASYTLAAGDEGTRIVMNNAGATTITVDDAVFSAGDVVWIHNIGAGTCTVTAGTATVSTVGELALEQYAGGHLYFTSASAAIFFPTEQGGGGKILQVVSTIKTDTFVSSSITTGSQTPITGLSASLTCASATNKVLIQVVLGMMASTAQAASAGLIIQAGGSNILVGDAAGSRTQVNASHLIYPGFGGGSVHGQLVWTGLYSPASTSAITYSVDIVNNDGSSRVMYVNRNEGDTDAAYSSRASSTITLMEVEA